MIILNNICQFLYSYSTSISVKYDNLSTYFLKLQRTYFSTETLKQSFLNAFQNRCNQQYLTMGEEVQHSPTSTHFQRFKLLLWKSYLWHRYYWWYTIIEIVTRCLVPVYLGMRVSSDIKFALHLPTYPAIHTREELMNTLEPHKYLAYSPSNEFTNTLMENVGSRISKGYASVALILSKNNLLVLYFSI